MSSFDTFYRFFSLVDVYYDRTNTFLLNSSLKLHLCSCYNSLRMTQYRTYKGDNDETPS